MRAMQYLGATVILSGIALCALGATPAVDAQNNVQNGQAGFVVSHFAYALSKDAGETGACPDGMTSGAVVE